MARWNDARVTKEKILDYLLSADHPVGRDKAAFFVSIGYERERWERLRDDLRAVPRQGDRITEQRSPFGVKYVIDGPIRSPSGRRVFVRTVWIADEPEDAPRLVTAYPRKEDSENV